MDTRNLKNKPLVEAIFELRWKLKQITQGIYIDPNYKIMIGQLYEKLKGDYPFHEALPSENLPDPIAGHVVQHRFRKSENGWPLVQIGQGVVTLNETTGYTWQEFRERAHKLVEAIFEIYPERDNLEISFFMLRYIDAIDFDYEKQDIIRFLKEKMKINMTISSNLFNKTGVESSPTNMDIKFSFPSQKPPGYVSLRFFRGIRNDNDSLLFWETLVQSYENEAPKAKDEILAYLSSAHELTHDWFFKIISGDLEKRFQ